MAEVRQLWKHMPLIPCCPDTDTGGALQSEIQSESLSLSLTQATNTINKKCGHNEFPITVKLRHNSEDVFVNSMV